MVTETTESTATTPLETTPISKMLLEEICDFLADCKRRYKFNNNWDNTLNVLGILTSVAIVAAGVFDNGKLSAILGGFVAALVTAQRAFPFGQRTIFYRNLIGQTQNLTSQCRFGTVEQSKAIQMLNNLRLDFAQQLPRGTTVKVDDSTH
jgi:hypothetical protein